MPSTPVITSPAQNSNGLGRRPRIFGSNAEPHYSVEIYQVDSGNYLGSGVAGADGQWAIDIDIPAVWISVTARCYAVKSDPGTYSLWSNPLTIHS